MTPFAALGLLHFVWLLVWTELTHVSSVLIRGLWITLNPISSRTKPGFNLQSVLPGKDSVKDAKGQLSIRPGAWDVLPAARSPRTYSQLMATMGGDGSHKFREVALWNMKQFVCRHCILLDFMLRTSHEWLYCASTHISLHILLETAAFPDPPRLDHGDTGIKSYSGVKRCGFCLRNVLKFYQVWNMQLMMKALN